MKKNLSGFVLLPILIVIALIIGGYYFYQNRLANKSITLTPTNLICSDFDSVTDTLKTNLSGNYTITVRDVPILPESTFLWRRSSQEPVISYPILKSRVMYLYAQPSVQSAKQLEGAVLNLNAKGFVTDDLNYTPYIESGITVGGSVTYGLLKEQDYYVMDLNGAYVNDVVFNPDGTTKEEIKLPENSSGITIACGMASSTYDEIYSTIIKTGTYNDKQKISIVEINDNVIHLNVSSVGGFGGAASYWMVANDGAEQLVKDTQQVPSCSVFELKKVGNGIACYDAQTKAQRTVHY